MATVTQGILPAATPAYVFRGHASTLHALHFYAQNQYLATGDADGWIIVWNLATRRPVAVWQAHKGSILGIKTWGTELLVTHGRDHSLRVWQVREVDYERLDKTLPAQRSQNHQGPEPWLLHSLAVNALNFCAFSLHGLSPSDDELLRESNNVPNVDLPAGVTTPVIVACPNALNSGGIDIFHLPSERRISTIKPDQSSNCGMVMTVKLVNDSRNGVLSVVSGYEDGHVMIHRRLQPIPGSDWQWEKVYLNRAHSQPVLSLDVAIDTQFFISSSADAMLVKHPLRDCLAGVVSKSSLKAINTKHAGQQDLTIRDDVKVFATAGWDARIRVYSVKSMQELAILKWHKEGCYAVDFARTAVEPNDLEADVTQTTLQKSTSALEEIKKRRAEKAQQTHWLAAGGKDGKITLWDIY